MNIEKVASAILDGEISVDCVSPSLSPLEMEELESIINGQVHGATDHKKHKEQCHE